MSKKAAAMNGESEPIPAFLRSGPVLVHPQDRADEPDDEPETGEVAPLTPPEEEPGGGVVALAEPEILGAFTLAMEEAANVSVPGISRAQAKRNERVVERRKLEAEKQGFVDQQVLLTGVYEAAMQSLDAQVKDIDAAIHDIDHGIGQDAPDTAHAH